MIRIHAFFQPFKTAFVTLAAALFFTSVVLWITGTNPFDTYTYLIKGSLGSLNKVSRVLQVWMPLTLCALGLLYTFKMNLWNIGVEGQMMMGAIFATGILKLSIPSVSPIPALTISFFAAGIGGGVWAAIAGYLKVKSGVNEIFAGLGMNFLAQGIILWLIFGPWKRPGIASMSGTEPFPREFWLPGISHLRMSPPALILLTLLFLLTLLILQHSRPGLALKAIGQNPNAAYRFAIKPNFYTLWAMFTAGAFAGLAGAIQVTDVYHRLIPAISSNYGYLALLVVMLSNYSIWLTPIISFFFACLNVGSVQLPMMLQIDSSLAGVIQGTLVIITLAVHGWQARRNRQKKGSFS